MGESSEQPSVPSAAPGSRRLAVLLSLAVAIVAAMFYLHATTDLFAPFAPAELAHFNTSNMAMNMRRAEVVGTRPKDYFVAVCTEQVAVEQGPSKLHCTAKIAPVDRAPMIADNTPVVGVEINGKARAYPLTILQYHEVINDVLGDTPIAITHCPLCDSTAVFDRRIDGETLQFGASGVLINSNVVLYDTTHDALWSQLRATAISGPYSGRSLKHLTRWRLTRFDAWRKEYPQSTVMTYDTGHDRTYEFIPAATASYSATGKPLFPVAHRDDRLGLRTRVIGIRTPQGTAAITVESIGQEKGVVEHTVDGRVFRFSVQADAPTVQLIEAPSDCQVIPTFWFAWVAFHPQTRVIQ